MPFGLHTRNWGLADIPLCRCYASLTIESAGDFVRLRTSEHRDEYGRAATDEAPEGVWLEVIRAYPQMRRWVAHNKTIPVAILEVLAIDQDEDVRLSVAIKRKLTPELFELLSCDPSPSVRERIALNEKVPPTVLARLAADANEVVAIGARSRLG